jgi:hypothetical protein
MDKQMDHDVKECGREVHLKLIYDGDERQEKRAMLS